MRASSALFGTLLCVSIGACTPSTTAPKAELSMPAAYSSSSAKPASVDPRGEAWWRRFNDSALDRLVRYGIKEGISIQQARQRLDIARLREVVALSSFFPQLQTGASGNRASRDSNGPNPTNAGLSSNTALSWKIDLFGSQRASQREAQANTAAAADEIEMVRLAYLTDLTITYIELRYNEEATAISRQNLASFQKTLTLTKSMRDTGSATNLDVAKAQALVDDALAKIPPLERDRQIAIHHLATLLGTTAAEISRMIDMQGRSRQPRLAQAATGLPADLLRNRPDIKREERLLAAAAARIDVAHARLYPTLTLNGTIDVARLVASGLSGNVVSWAFGPTVLAPILDGDKLRTEVDIASAETRVQYLRWKDTVFRAVEEVENALVSLNRGAAETKAHSRKIASYAASRDLARESYIGGTGLVLDVLEAERFLGDARIDLAQSLRANAISAVRLRVALGSGSTVEASAESSPPIKPPVTAPPEAADAP